MNYIDLHVHTNASDGTLSPREVIDMAKAIPLKAIALTDHDTVAGIPEAIYQAQDSALEVIPGIELSCLYGKTELHLLGLYIDYQNPELLNVLQQIQTDRVQRNQKMILNFQKAGIDLDFEELADQNSQTVITRAHFANALLKKGYVSSMAQAFHQYLAENGKFCEPKKELSYQQAMYLLRSAHAFPVLAHPLQYHLGYREIEELIKNLLPLGLKGLEVYHSSNNQNESGKLKVIAQSHHLLPTGGSDFHGIHKPDIQLGFGRGQLRVSELLLTDIKQAINQEGI